MSTDLKNSCHQANSQTDQANRGDSQEDDVTVRVNTIVGDQRPTEYGNRKSLINKNFEKLPTNFLNMIY